MPLAHPVPRIPARHRAPHAGQSLDPTLTRKGVFSHPSRIVFGLGGILFASYVFNFGGTQTELDSLFRGLDQTARSKNSDVAGFVIGVLPYLGVAAGVALLLVLASVLGRGAKRMKRRKRLGSRDQMSLHQFAAEAAQHQVCPKVAREMYRMLEPYYPSPMRVTLADTFATDLSMKPTEISDLLNNLLRRTDRQMTASEAGREPSTVLDMMTLAEATTVRSLTRSKQHVRAEREAAHLKVTQRASVGRRLSQTFTRSVLRRATQAAAPLRDEIVIKPVRLERRGTDYQEGERRAPVVVALVVPNVSTASAGAASQPAI